MLALCATALFGVVAGAPVHAQRVVPGQFPSPFLKSLANAPNIEDDAEHGAPRWLPYSNTFASQASRFARAGITVAQRNSWDAQMREIATMVRQAPSLARPINRDYEITSSLETVAEEFFGPGGIKTAPLRGTLLVWPWAKSDVQTLPNGTLKLVRGAHTNSFGILFNAIPRIPPGPWMRDSVGSFFPHRFDGTFDGMPMHGWELVITRNNRSPYRAISLERAIKAFLASHLGSSKSAASARNMLSSLSPAELKAQAWICDEEPRWSLEHCFVPPNTRNGVPLVEEDLNFFDRSLPRHAIQIMTVYNLNNVAKGSERDQRNAPLAVHLALLHEVDWKTIRDRFVK